MGGGGGGVVASFAEFYDNEYVEHRQCYHSM